MQLNSATIAGSAASVNNAVLIVKAACIDIQPFCNRVYGNVCACFLKQFGSRSCPIGTIRSYKFCDSFEEWVGRFFPEFSFLALKLPIERVGIFCEYQLLLLLVTPGYFKRGSV